MNFDFSEEQRLLQQTARDYLDEHCPIDRCREILESDALDNIDAESVIDAVDELGIDEVIYENPDAALDTARSMIDNPGDLLEEAQDVIDSIQIQSQDTSFNDTTGIADTGY